MAGGYSLPAQDAVDWVEALDVRSDGDRTCPDLAPLPDIISEGIGFVVDNKPIICGGLGKGFDRLKDCYRYDPSFNAWSQVRKLEHYIIGTIFFRFGGNLGSASGPNIPSHCAAMLALDFDCSTVALHTPRKALSN